MDDVRLFFGRPAITDIGRFISALKDLQSRSGCTIQALDASKVVSDKHLIFAAQKALKAFSEGRNIAKDLGVEVLRYASGERQIERAMSMGITEATKRIALVVIPREGRPRRGCTYPEAQELSGLVVDDSLGCSYDISAVKNAFNISEEEVWAAGSDKIPELVLERVALVDTYR